MSESGSIHRIPGDRDRAWGRRCRCCVFDSKRRPGRGSPRIATTRRPPASSRVSMADDPRQNKESPLEQAPPRRRSPSGPLGQPTMVPQVVYTMSNGPAGAGGHRRHCPRRTARQGSALSKIAGGQDRARREIEPRHLGSPARERQSVEVRYGIADEGGACRGFRRSLPPRSRQARHGLRQSVRWCRQPAVSRR